MCAAATASSCRGGVVTTSSITFSTTIPLLLCSAVAVLVFASISIPVADAKADFVYCSNAGEFTLSSPYATNLNLLLSGLVNSTPSIGYSNLTAGGSLPDPNALVYGLALCRGDLNATVCASCLAVAARDVVEQCPGSLAGGVFYDECRLRYASDNFFTLLTPNPIDPYLYSLRHVANSELFADRFGRLMRGLQQQAVTGNGSGLYASGSIDYPGSDGGRLFGMVQCTRDLPAETCGRCLDGPIQEILCCEDNEEVTYQGGSCYMRYGFYPFFNASVVALPPLSSQPQQLMSLVSNDTVDGSQGLFTSGKSGGAGGRGSSEAGKRRVTTILAIVLGVAMLALLALVAVRKRKRGRPKFVVLGRNLEVPPSPGSGLFSMAKALKYRRNPESAPKDLHKLDLQTIRLATDNFSESTKIGTGDFGMVFKGELPNQEFVVKRLMANPRMELTHVKKEIKSLAKLQHPNISRMLTYFIEEEEKLLVYEYFPNTSLDKVLFDEKKRVLLDWGRRFKIIQGIAQGLQYLHGDSEPNIIHMNLKSRNVLLDKHMAPKLTDFCLPNLFVGIQNPSGTKKNTGQGYMAPEYITNGLSSSKTDVFSYGVLILEIITGQKNRYLLGSESATNLLSYVWQCWKHDKTLQVLDWSLGELYKEHEVTRCIHLGLLCVQEDPEKRPDISSIVRTFNDFSAPLPSPLAPPTLRLKRSNDAGNPSRNGNSSFKEFKFVSQSIGQSRTQSGHNWAEIKIGS